MSDIRKDIERISKDVEKLKCCTTGEVSGGDPCCPETNNILTNIGNDINSVIETCNDITITPQSLIVRPTSAQNTGLYCDLLGCGCETATGSKDLDYIGQINLVSGTTVEFNRVSSDGETVNTWQLTILDLSNNIQTVFSGTNVDYNNPLGNFDLGAINTGFYYLFSVSYANGLTSQSKGYFKINQDSTTVEHRSALLYSLNVDCNGIVLNQSIRLDNPDITTSTQGTGTTTNETNATQLKSFNVPQNVTTPDIYLDPVLLPFSTSGTKTASIIFNFNDGIVISYFFDKTVTQTLFTEPTDATSVFPNSENSYDGNNNTSWQIGNVNNQEAYQVDWTLSIAIPQCQDNSQGIITNLKFFIDIEAFNTAGNDNGFIIAVTDGTTMYGQLNSEDNAIVLGINEIPITTPIPENALENLKIFFAFSNYDFTIKEVYAEVQYNCTTEVEHQVIPVKITCTPEKGLPVEVKNDINFDKTGLSTETTLTSVRDRINYLINQPSNIYTSPVKATLMDGGKNFGYVRNNYVYIDGSITAQSIEFSTDGANWIIPNVNDYELGWYFNDEEEIMLTAGNSHTIQPNSVHSYSIVVTGTGTGSYYTLNGGTPIPIKDGYSKQITFEVYNNQQIDIYCDNNDEIRILKQW